MPSLKSLKLPRLRSLLSCLKTAGRVAVNIVKYAFASAVIFVLIPQLFIYAEVGPRLHANIYDFYGFLLLIFIIYRLHMISRVIDQIKDNPDDSVVFKEQIVADVSRAVDVDNLKRLKKKLDRRRSKKTPDDK
jgi:hypothetical protein